MIVSLQSGWCAVLIVIFSRSNTTKAIAREADLFPYSISRLTDWNFTPWYSWLMPVSKLIRTAIRHIIKNYYRQWGACWLVWGRYSVHVDLDLPDEFPWKMNFSLQKTSYVALLFPPYGNNDNLWPLQSLEVTLIFQSHLRCSYISSAGITPIFVSILFRFVRETYCNQVPFRAVSIFIILVTNQVAYFFFI
jgi:hypothetical protein